jgi:hypothetical protein
MGPELSRLSNAITPTALHHILPAVDRKRRAGNGAGLVGGEKHHSAGDFVGLAEAIDRDQRQDALLQHVLRHRLHHLRDGDFAIVATELHAEFYRRWMDEEQATKKMEKILGFCSRLDGQLELSDLLIYFCGDKEVWELKRILESIRSRKRAKPSLNAKQKARNDYMEQILGDWSYLGGKLGGADSPMVAFFRAAWPKTLIRYLPTDEAIVSWAYKKGMHAHGGR